MTAAFSQPNGRGRMHIDSAVEKYNALRVRGNDHGIIGAYNALVDEHGRERLPSLSDLLNRRAYLSRWSR